MTSLTEEIEALILAEIPGAIVTATGGGGHFTIKVISEAFRGKNRIQKQRMVYKAIWDLMKGDNAPVHAVDQMICEVPE